MTRAKTSRWCGRIWNKLSGSPKPVSDQSPSNTPVSPGVQEGQAKETAPAANVISTSNGEEIEWQDSADVYAPTVIAAADFVPMLGMTHPPAILPQQSYIFIARPALTKVQTHLRGNVNVEQGGLLLGQAFLDADLKTYLLLVHDALPAPDGIETPTFFGYTPASWRALTPHLQQMNPDWTILGTYHSHPNMGVFLSETDLDTQEAIFAADWQIALVIDPVNDEIGFFVGKEGRPCAEWYVRKG